MQASALILSNSVRLYLVWRFVHIQPYDLRYARLAIPAAAGAAAMLAVHAALSGPKWGIDLAVTALSGSVVYCVVLLFFGLTLQERGSVMRLARKVLR